MKLLFTNDDGVTKYGILALANEAVRRGHTVYMVAPKEQRSANSHFITIHNPIEVYELKDRGYYCYAVDGSPADCTRIALLAMLEDEIDMVISGINNGYNAGRAVIYSGTCAAAREAVILGKKAIASSIDDNASKEMIDFAAKFTIDMAEKLYIQKVSIKDAFLNINVPALPVSEIKEAKMAYVSEVVPNDNYIAYESPRHQKYYFLNNTSEWQSGNPGSDVGLLNQSHITLSFISIAEDKTVHEADFLS